MDPTPAACPPCPKCGATRTRFTVKATYGLYCYCDACANAWYHEREPEPPPSDTVLHPQPKPGAR